MINIQMTKTSVEQAALKAPGVETQSSARKSSDYSAKVKDDMINKALLSASNYTQAAR